MKIGYDRWDWSVGLTGDLFYYDWETDTNMRKSGPICYYRDIRHLVFCNQEERWIEPHIPGSNHDSSTIPRGQWWCRT
jgi:hypothetical protein